MLSLIAALALQDPAAGADPARRALDYLASKQAESGEIQIQGNGVFGNKDAANVMTTALAGLAFLASGEPAYQKNIDRVTGWLTKVVQERLPNKGVNGDTWPAALATLYFSHLFERDRGEAARRPLEALVAFLTRQQSRSGGWSLGYTRGFVTETQTDLTAAVNLCIVALGRAKEAGVEVDEAVFERSRGFFEKTYRPAGWFNYMLSRDNGEPRWGRSVASVLALMHLGEADSEKYKATLEFARANMDKVMSHHVPHLHMLLCANVYRAMGEEDWKAFRGMHFEKILARQREDGSVASMFEMDKKIMMSYWTDHNFGSPYATALFALLVQVEKGKVRLAPRPGNWY
jgi:hypothetical protein